MTDGTKTDSVISWFSFTSIGFAFWGFVFTFFPKFTNEFAGLSYTDSAHAEDWTMLVGLLSFGFAVLAIQAHRSESFEVKGVVAVSILSCALPCALLMTYWQLIPDRRWIRLDVMNIFLLYLMSLGMFLHIRQWRRKRGLARGEQSVRPSRPVA